MHFNIPFYVTIFDDECAQVTFMQTEKQCREEMQQLRGVDIMGKLEAKIDGNRLLIRIPLDNGEWAWVEAEKAKD